MAAKKGDAQIEPSPPRPPRSVQHKPASAHTPRATRSARLHTQPNTQALPARARSQAPPPNGALNLRCCRALERWAAVEEHCMSPFGAARMLHCFKHKDPGRGVIAQIALYAPPSATSLTRCSRCQVWSAARGGTSQCCRRWNAACRVLSAVLCRQRALHVDSRLSSFSS
jgi:hypothetical protein